MKPVFLKKLPAAVLLAALLLSACGRTPAPKQPSVDFAALVKAYTGRSINDESTVKVEFVAPVPGAVAGEELPSGVVSFSPSVAGTAIWTGPSSMEFVPDEGAFKAGKNYSCSIALDKLLGVKDKDLSTFSFPVCVAPRRAEVKLEYAVITPESPAQAMVFGQVILSQRAEMGIISEMLGSEAEVEESESGKEYAFVINGIDRGASDKDYSLKVKDAGGFKVTAPGSVVIPGTADGFRVVDCIIHENIASPYIDVVFSEPTERTTSKGGGVFLDGVGRGSFSFANNVMRVYFDKRTSELIQLKLNSIVQSTSGEKLPTDFAKAFPREESGPGVEILLSGNILPDSKQLILPFKATGLSAVDLSVIKIYEDNVLQFLQDNSLGGESDLRRSGRRVLSKTIPLDGEPGLWKEYSVDLAGLFKEEPGAIYRIRLTFKKEYATSFASSGLVAVESPSDEEDVWDYPSAWYYESFIDWDEYDWSDRNDPSKPSYYMVEDRFPVVNLLASNIGLIAKYSGGDKLWATASDIVSASPMGGAELNVYNYQLQTIGSARTSGNGMAEIELSGKPFILTARKGGMTSYLKVSDGYEKSLSRFDVGGKRLEKGLKGFVYGERGVWRPGDTLHVTLMLLDKEGRIPSTHPATLDLYSPEGQFYCKKVCPSGTDGFYAFEIPTYASDPTGIWNAYVKVGGATFHKALRIESIKPNRLKIETGLGGDRLQGGSKTPLNLASRWLTGPPASGLQAKVTLNLCRASTSFPGFEGYTFSDPTSTFTSSEHTLWSGRLDSDGKAGSIITVPQASDAPGMLSAMVLSTVTEEGGDESFVTTTVPFSPFNAYVGVKAPSGDLETDKDQVFKVALVSPDGKRVAGHRLQYQIYKVNWSWWWENGAEGLGSYVQGNMTSPWAIGTLTSGQNDAEVTLRVDYPEWGRFLIYVKDLDGGHASGMVTYVDWPSWRGRADRRDPDALTMLSFSTDKKSYEAGETATVYIPAAEGGKALVSLENATGVISREWVSTAADKDTPYRFKVTADMAPNFYIHVTLVQPHGNAVNDLPVRMYGVEPVLVSNKESRLEPVITVAESVHPEEEFHVKVSERNGKQITYTLALVDEGLLDITSFKTPDPWNAMYAREALGVRTFDLYDEVVGAFAGKFSPMLGIGGDESMNMGKGMDNRFNAVVKFLGPFTMAKGGDTHKIKLPAYVGSLRVMVVAGNAAGAYGNASKNVTVKSPLMVVPTLPRVISTDEKVVLPVNVFALEDGVKSAKVTVSVDGPVRVTGAAETSVAFAKPGDELVNFALETLGEGYARVTVTASGGGQKASETINIQVRNPNPYITRVQRKMLQGGESASFEWPPFSDGRATLELSTFPAIDLDSAFEFVKSYTYNCSEQITARGINLVYTLDLISKENVEKAREMVPGLLQDIYGRQLADGGFGYWPGVASADTWVTSMAGVFMLGAKDKGFEVEKGVLSSWTAFQKKAVQNWRKSNSPALDDLDQAFRLYTLALAGSADNASMNRLKENPNLSLQATRMLASAYALAGKKEVAKGMLENREEAFENYPPDKITYGSSLRDKAMAVETYTLTGRLPEALEVAAGVADSFSDGWWSTQELAFASMAMKRLADVTGNAPLSCTVDGKDVTTPKTGQSMPLETRAGKVSVANKSEALSYISLLTVSKPTGNVAAEASGMRIKVSYLDENGKEINPAVLAQGTEFTAVITVANTSLSDNLDNVALTQMVPSGWEIRNERLMSSAQNSYTYNDIRDDRNLWYFDLPMGKSKTFKTRLRAAYEGEFILPSIKCEAMYDPHSYARTASGTAKVTK